MPVLGVRTMALWPSTSPARFALLNAGNPDPSSRTSTSRTSGPGAPVAIATLRFGSRRHQSRIWRSSVDASWNPLRVAGSLLPGRHGNTGQPARA